MTDLDRNTRTLIVCFSVALLVLIPLRFVEVGQQVMMVGQSQVLGESAEKEVMIPVVKRIHPAQLQAPYDKIDGVLGESDVIDCLGEGEARVLIEELTSGLVMGDYTEVEVGEALEEVEEIERRLCE